MKEVTTYLTEYLGGGKSEDGESDGSIIGTGDGEADMSGVSGPSVAELWSEECSGAVSAVVSTCVSSMVTTPPAKVRVSMVSRLVCYIPEQAAVMLS